MAGLMKMLMAFVLIAVVISEVHGEYVNIGCYDDDGDRAIQSLEGTDPVLDINYGSRENPIAKCALAATNAGYSMFAVQDGGQCFASATAPQTFDKHGKSTACNADGEGGFWANQVYLIKNYETIGCYKDDGDRAIQSLEETDSVLDINYGSRENPIAKCALAAMRAGYGMFAVQDGGQCFASSTAPQTYDKYGESTACDDDGEGGFWANQVYVIQFGDPAFAAAHIPQLRFDGGASNNCFPDEATESNDGQCRSFNSDAPIYYDIRDCGDYRKIVWWIWYGKQKTCDCCSGSHGNDWEHITINFVKENSVFKQDSVTWFQHDGWYTRSNTDSHPNIYVGKSAHGSYDNWCDGKGFSWEQDYCPGGCGYWNDYRNDDSSPWIPHNIKHISEVTGSVSYRSKDGEDSKIKNEKHFDDASLNGCIGDNSRCVIGPCGCWRNNHWFGSPQCSYA